MTDSNDEIRAKNREKFEKRKEAKKKKEEKGNDFSSYLIVK